MFYPLKVAKKAVPYGVHLTSFLFNNRIGNDFDTSKIQYLGGLLFLLEMFYLRVGWGGLGWGGWTEYQKCSSIFFILCGYIDHVNLVRTLVRDLKIQMVPFC